jgi:hypothetical protein
MCWDVDFTSEIVIFQFYFGTIADVVFLVLHFNTLVIR